MDLKISEEERSRLSQRLTNLEVEFTLRLSIADSALKQKDHSMAMLKRELDGKLRTIKALEEEGEKKDQLMMAIRNNATSDFNRMQQRNKYQEEEKKRCETINKMHVEVVENMKIKLQEQADYIETQMKNADKFVKELQLKQSNKLQLRLSIADNALKQKDEAMEHLKSELEKKFITIKSLVEEREKLETMMIAMQNQTTDLEKLQKVNKDQEEEIICLKQVTQKQLESIDALSKLRENVEDMEIDIKKKDEFVKELQLIQSQTMDAIQELCHQKQEIERKNIDLTKQEQEGHQILKELKLVADSLENQLAIKDRMNIELTNKYLNLEFEAKESFFLVKDLQEQLAKKEGKSLAYHIFVVILHQQV